MKATTRGYLYVMAAAVLWASSGTAGKALFLAGMTPFELVQVRVTLAALAMVLVLGMSAPAQLRIRLRDVSSMLLLGGLIMATVQFTYLFAISKIQVVAAILIQYTAPIMVAVYSVLFWGERLTVSKVFALVLALLGCYLVVGAYNVELLHMNRVGIIAAICSAVFFTAYTLVGERMMHRYRPWTVVFYSMVFAAVTWNVVRPPLAFLQSSYTMHEWGLILFIVLFGTVAAFGLFFAGVNHIRSTRAAVTSTMEPISAGFIAFVFLGEALAPLQIFGAVLVIGAIVLLQVEREHSELTPELIRSAGRESVGQGPA
ncbi:MAG: DMT family transporter [Desulfomonilaceae bacterium]|nr:DMT family transporter [Desulfomonilaceae bacterium]